MSLQVGVAVALLTAQVGRSFIEKVRSKFKNEFPCEFIEGFVMLCHCSNGVLLIIIANYCILLYIVASFIFYMSGFGMSS